jgi:hypothetical protein
MQRCSFAVRAQPLSCSRDNQSPQSPCSRPRRASIRLLSTSLLSSRWPIPFTAALVSRATQISRARAHGGIVGYPRKNTRAIALALACSLLSVTSANAHEGWGIVVQQDGTVLFADIPTNTIWRVSRGGAVEIAVANKHSHALVLAGDGSIYGTHEHVRGGRAGEVWRLLPDGSLSVVLQGSPDFPLSLHAFTIDQSGTLYSTNLYAGPQGVHQLMRRSPDGAVSVVAGGRRGQRDGVGQEAQFSGIDGITVAPDGTLFLTDGSTVRRVTSDNGVSMIARDLTSPAYGEDLMGVSYEHGGTLLVADYSGGRVLRVSVAGAVQTIASSAWPWSPTGATSLNSEVFVLEHLRMPLPVLGNLQLGPYARVRVISRDGSSATIAILWGRWTWLLPPAVLSGVALLLWYRRRRAHGRGPSNVNAEVLTRSGQRRHYTGTYNRLFRRHR